MMRKKDTEIATRSPLLEQAWGTCDFDLQHVKRRPKAIEIANPE